MLEVYHFKECNALTPSMSMHPHHLKVESWSLFPNLNNYILCDHVTILQPFLLLEFHHCFAS